MTDIKIFMISYQGMVLFSLQSSGWSLTSTSPLPNDRYMIILDEYSRRKVKLTTPPSSEVNSVFCLRSRAKERGDRRFKVKTTIFSHISLTYLSLVLWSSKSLGLFYDRRISFRNFCFLPPNISPLSDLLVLPMFPLPFP